MTQPVEPVKDLGSSAIGFPASGTQNTAGERLDQLKGVSAFVLFNGPDWMCDAVEWAINEIRARIAAEQRAQENYDWMVSVCENPPPPTEELKALFREYGAFLDPLQNRLAPAVTSPSDTRSKLADEPSNSPQSDTGGVK